MVSTSSLNYAMKHNACQRTSWKVRSGRTQTAHLQNRQTIENCGLRLTAPEIDSLWVLFWKQARVKKQGSGSFSKYWVREHQETPSPLLALLANKVHKVHGSVPQSCFWCSHSNSEDLAKKGHNTGNPPLHFSSPEVLEMRITIGLPTTCCFLDSLLNLGQQVKS